MKHYQRAGIIGTPKQNTKIENTSEMKRNLTV